MTAAAPLTREIGQTENALRAVLAALIADSPFPTYPAGVSMMVLAQGGPTDITTLSARITAATHEPAAVVNDLLANLLARGILVQEGSIVTMSESGQASFATVRDRVTAATFRIHAGISADDLDATRRTLGTLLAAARQELEAAAV